LESQFFFEKAEEDYSDSEFNFMNKSELLRWFKQWHKTNVIGLNFKQVILPYCCHWLFVKNYKNFQKKSLDLTEQVMKKLWPKNRHNTYLHFYNAVDYCQQKAFLAQLVSSGDLYLTS